MESEEILEFLGRAVRSIKPDLKELSDDELLQVREAEATGDDRGSLIELIDKEIEARSEGKDAAPDAGGKEARGEKTPPYQKADYSGPLTIQQAAWRNQNIRQK